MVCDSDEFTVDESWLSAGSAVNGPHALSSTLAGHDVQREAEANLEFARQIRFGFEADIITGQLRLIRTLRGLTPQFVCFDDTEFDESRFEQHLAEHPELGIVACWYFVRKLQARFFAGADASALEAAENARRLHQRSSLLASTSALSSIAVQGTTTAAPMNDCRSID